MGLPGGYSILAKGYELRGSLANGLSATIPFIMPWSEAFAFITDLLPAPSAVTSSIILWHPVYQFPVYIGGSAVPLYAESYTCVPCGRNGNPVLFNGLEAGDYFSTALVTVEFATPSYSQQQSDDPSGLSQLDPGNPLTYCEQSIQTTSKVTTQKGSAYKYTSGSFSGKPVPGEIGVIQPEAKLVLKFPKIPVLPWQLIQPYVGKINSRVVLNCVTGSLLLEGSSTIVTAATDGTIAQNFGLNFAFNPDPTGGSLTGMDWNYFPIPDGSGYAKIASNGVTPYSYADFTQIFTSLSTGTNG
jgi:hypothetical protein